MELQVKKRNGKIVPFDKQKIITAINKAFIEVDGQLYETETAEEIANDIENAALESREPLTVEEIQDLVETELMESERKDVARGYVRFRYKQEVSRNKSNDFIKAVREKLEGTHIENQNANVDEKSFGGRQGEASNLLNKKLALDFIISEKSRKLHENNEIYIHDLSSYYVGCHNCLSIPFDDLLANGFNTRQVDIRPANSVETAFQLIAVIFQLQSLQQFGGVSATHIDWTLVPYVRKSFAKHYKNGLLYISEISSDDIDYEIENMLKNAKDYSIEDKEWQAYNYKAYKYAQDVTRKEVYQGAEGLFHNLNSL